MRCSVVVCDQGALDRRSYLPVVPDGGVERQQALHDPGPQSGGDPAAVAFQAELVLQRPDDGLNTAGWCSSICRAWSRSPKSWGLARPNPVTVPSQVQLSISLEPHYQREWPGR